MTTSYATDQGDVLEMVDKLRSGIGEAAGLINSMIDGINSVLNSLPPEEVGGIRNGVADLQRMFNECATELQRALDQAGDPVALRAAGAAWAVDIGGSVSGLSGLTTENTIRADNHWTGAAADAYRNTLLPQRLALNAVKTTGDKIDAVLNELANAIITFWKNVEGAVITLLVALVAAAASAAGGITAVIGIGIAAHALVAFKDAVISQSNMFTEVGNAISVQTREIQAVRADNTAFPDEKTTMTNGDWPAATATDFNDGSITDGDDTDWHIK